MSVKSGYLSNLTPLRGLAAILVAVFHFEMAIGRFVPAGTTMFFEKSYLMVDLFFVLSGFIMLHVYGRAFDGVLQRGQLRHFLVARFARTYPLHLFSLLLLVVIVRYLTNWGNPPIVLEQPRDILPNVFMLQSFGVCPYLQLEYPFLEYQCGVGRISPFPLPGLMDQPAAAGWRRSCWRLGWWWRGAALMYVLPRKNPLNPAIPVPHNLNTTFDYGWLRGVAGFSAGMIMYQFYRIIGCRPVNGRRCGIGADPVTGGGRASFCDQRCAGGCAICVRWC